MLPVVIAVCTIIGIGWASRSRELFYLSVRSGRVLLVRGHIPAGLLASFRDILKETTLTGSVKALKQDNGGRLVCSSNLQRGTVQRLRNTFSLYPAAKLRQSAAKKRPALGQLIGIAWIAWLLEDRL